MNPPEAAGAVRNEIHVSLVRRLASLRNAITVGPPFLASTEAPAVTSEFMDPSV